MGSVNKTEAGDYGDVQNVSKNSSRRSRAWYASVQKIALLAKVI